MRAFLKRLWLGGVEHPFFYSVSQPDFRMCLACGKIRGHRIHADAMAAWSKAIGDGVEYVFLESLKDLPR